MALRSCARVRQQGRSSIKLETDQSVRTSSAHQANLCSSQQSLPPTLASLYYYIVLHQVSGVIVHVGWMGVVERNKGNHKI